MTETENERVNLPTLGASFSSEGGINCCELLIEEHRRTEALLERLETLLLEMAAVESVELNRVLEAQALYQTLADDLQRHYALEEKALFPVLSQYRSMMLMAVEHEDLLQLQSEFAEGLMHFNPERLMAQVDMVSVVRRFQTFKARLQGHILEEERGVFPLANASLELEEKVKVLRLLTELVETTEPEAYQLVRPLPGYRIQRAQSSKTALETYPPMLYQTLFEQGHSQVQTLRLQAGQKQALHWAGQTQFILVLSGTLGFQVGTLTGGQTVASEEGITERLEPGDTLTLDSRLVYALSAETEVLMILVKVWPHPHYTKA